MMLKKLFSRSSSSLGRDDDGDVVPSGTPPFISDPLQEYGWNKDVASVGELDESYESTRSVDHVNEAFTRRIGDMRATRRRGSRGSGEDNVCHASVMSVTSSVMTPRRSNRDFLEENVDDRSAVTGNGSSGGCGTILPIREVEDRGGVRRTNSGLRRTGSGIRRSNSSGSRGSTGSRGSSRGRKEKENCASVEVGNKETFAQLHGHLSRAEWEDASKIINSLPLPDADGDGSDVHPNDTPPATLLFAAASHADRPLPSTLLRHLLRRIRSSDLGHARDSNGDCVLHLLCRNPYSSYDCIHSVLVAFPGAAATANLSGNLPLHEYIRTTMRTSAGGSARPYVGGILWAMLCVVCGDPQAARCRGSDKDLGPPLHIAVRYAGRAFDGIGGSPAFLGEKKMRGNDPVAMDNIARVFYDLCVAFPEASTESLSDRLLKYGGEEVMNPVKVHSSAMTPYDFFTEHVLDEAMTAGLGPITKELYTIRTDVLSAFTPPGARSGGRKTKRISFLNTSATNITTMLPKSRTADVVVRLYKIMCMDDATSDWTWIKGLPRTDIKNLMKLGGCAPDIRHFQSKESGPILRTAMLCQERYGIMPCACVDMKRSKVPREQGAVLRTDSRRGGALWCTAVDYGGGGSVGRQVSIKFVGDEDEFLREIMCYSHLRCSGLSRCVLPMMNHAADIAPFDPMADLFGAVPSSSPPSSPASSSLPPTSPKTSPTTATSSRRKKKGFLSKRIDRETIMRPLVGKVDIFRRAPVENSTPNRALVHPGAPALNHVIVLAAYKRNLADFMGNGGVLRLGNSFDKMDNARLILGDVAKGLRDMHERGFIHGNLTAQNVACLDGDRFALFNLECSRRFDSSGSCSDNESMDELPSHPSDTAVEYIPVKHLGSTGILPPEMFSRSNNPSEIEALVRVDSRLVLAMRRANAHNNGTVRSRPKFLSHTDGYTYVLRAYSDRIINPEMHARSDPLSACPTFDIWSFGVLVYQICSDGGRTLFPVDGDNELIDADSFRTLCEWDKQVAVSTIYRNVRDPLAADLLGSILPKQSDRLKTMVQVLLHPFFDPRSRADTEIMRKYADRHAHILDRLYSQDEIELDSRERNLQMKLQSENQIKEIEEKTIVLRTATLGKARAEMARILTWMSPGVQSGLFFCPLKICKYLDKDVRTDTPLAAVVLPDVPDTVHSSSVGVMGKVNVAFTNMQDCAALFGVINTKRQVMGEDLFDETVKSMWEHNIQEATARKKNKHMAIDEVVMGTFLDLVGLSVSSRARALNLIASAGQTLKGDYQVVEIDDDGEESVLLSGMGSPARCGSNGLSRVLSNAHSLPEQMKKICRFFSNPLESSAKLAMSATRTWYGLFNNISSQVYLFDEYHQTPIIHPSFGIKINSNLEENKGPPSFPYSVPTTPENFCHWAPVLILGRRPSIFLRRPNAEPLDRYEDQYLQSRKAELAVIRAALNTYKFPGVNEEYFFRDLSEATRPDQMVDIAPLQLIYSLTDPLYDGLHSIAGPENCMIWTTESGLFGIQKESEPQPFL